MYRLSTALLYSAALIAVNNAAPMQSNGKMIQVFADLEGGEELSKLLGCATRWKTGMDGFMSMQHRTMTSLSFNEAQGSLVNIKATGNKLIYMRFGYIVEGDVVEDGHKWGLKKIGKHEMLTWDDSHEFQRCPMPELSELNKEFPEEKPVLEITYLVKSRSGPNADDGCKPINLITAESAAQDNLKPCSEGVRNIEDAIESIKSVPSKMDQSAEAPPTEKGVDPSGSTPSSQSQLESGCNGIPQPDSTGESSTALSVVPGQPGADDKDSAGSNDIKSSIENSQSSTSPDTFGSTSIDKSNADVDSKFRLPNKLVLDNQDKTQNSEKDSWSTPDANQEPKQSEFNGSGSPGDDKAGPSTTQNDNRSSQDPSSDLSNINNPTTSHYDAQKLADADSSDEPKAKTRELTDEEKLLIDSKKSEGPIKTSSEGNPSIAKSTQTQPSDASFNQNSASGQVELKDLQSGPYKTDATGNPDIKNFSGGSNINPSQTNELSSESPQKISSIEKEIKAYLQRSKITYVP